MLSDKIEYIFLGKNPTWGEWLDDLTFQTYPNTCPDHTVQFSTLKVFTLKLSKNSRLTLLDKSSELYCSLEEEAVLFHQGLPKRVGSFCLEQNARLVHRNINKNAVFLSI